MAVRATTHRHNRLYNKISFGAQRCDTLTHPCLHFRFVIKVCVRQTNIKMQAH